MKPNMQTSRDKRLLQQYEESKLRIEGEQPPQQMSVQELHEAIEMLEHQMQLVPAYHDAVMLEAMKCLLLQLELTDLYLATDLKFGYYSERLSNLVTQRFKKD